MKWPKFHLFINLIFLSARCLLDTEMMDIEPDVKGFLVKFCGHVNKHDYVQ